MQMENSRDPQRSGLYIHIPFCVRKCPYCDFYSTTELGFLDDFLACLRLEMQRVEKPLCPFDTIHLGGGTPSLLAPRQVEAVLAGAFSCFTFEKDVELTVEVNPGALNPDFLQAFLGAGGNRVNLGVQSFRNDRLAFLGRIHKADQARDAIQVIRKAGVKNMGLDLIYGLPGQDRHDWSKDMSEAVSYEPEHISCYMLTYEKDTPLDRMRRQGAFRPLEEDALGALFEETIRFLGANGYEQYEISNFSRGGKYASRHNRKYWFHQPYIGVGPSAHSFTGLRRWWNVRDLFVYLDRLKQGESAVQDHEILTPRQHMLEAFFLGLRTTAGIDPGELERRFGEVFKKGFLETLNTLRQRRLEGLVDVSEGRCALTRKGQVFADTVNAVFAECIKG
jgi:oxygen-independent coproporphyrinogen-3 oxidase